MSRDTAPNAHDSAPHAPGSRRDVLTLLLGTWGAGVVAAIVYPVLRFLVPPNIPEAAALTVSAGRASDLAPNSGRVVPFGSEPALVVRTASGELRAFTAVCTHLSCTVQYRSDLQEIWCACHNGHYDLTGKNVSGPPPKPLRAYDVNVKGDEIIVSRTA